MLYNYAEEKKYIYMYSLKTLYILINSYVATNEGDDVNKA